MENKQHIMNQPLLAVIVPCYHVEKYMDKCILSIVNQTYHNLEILLIDDGSTDNTGKICDEWQTRDSRIRVIHKQNEGLPAARKTGVENACADFVAFVDSDDWIDPNMYEKLMSALLATNSDIADSDICSLYEDGRIEHRINVRDATIKTMEQTEGFIAILKDKNWRSSFCTKIFKKKLFDNIVFPKQQYGEDLTVAYLFHNASKSVFVNDAYYFYCKRSGSICQQDNIGKKISNGNDWIDIYFDLYSFVKQHSEYHEILQHAKNVLIFHTIELLRSMVEYPQYSTDEQFKIKAKQMRSILITKEDNLKRSRKIELQLIRTNIKLYRFLRSFYHRIIHITNRLKITNKQVMIFITD